MKKFKVTFLEVVSMEMIVEAENQEDAEEYAINNSEEAREVSSECDYYEVEEIK